jgi:uncharacterized protein
VSPSSLKLSRYVVWSDPLIAGGHKTARVLFATRTGKVMAASESVRTALATASWERLPADLLDELIRAEVLVPAEQDELATVIEENKEAIEQQSELYQVVQPTALCQLGCGYCGQEHAARLLPPRDQDRFVSRVKRRLASGRYSGLRIGWFGAEPLAGMRVIRRLSPLLQEAAGDARCRYSAKIVTNGLTLTEERATELVGEHMVDTAEITLDGLEAHHDARRFTKTGKGTFHRIFTNLCRIAALPELPLQLIVRCNVDQTNRDGVPALIDALAEQGLQRRISFYVAPIHSWGNDAHHQALSHEDFAAWEIEWLAQLINRGFGVGLVPARKRIVCLAVQSDGELIDAYGDSFNCTEVSMVPSYGSPNVYAREPSGRETPESKTLRTFNDGVASGRYDSCARCPMLPVCGGACPKLWEEGHLPCPSAKFNIRERLNLVYAASRREAA